MYNMKTTLTKREYLGEGYIFEFKNNETGEHIIIPCTKEEYEAIQQSADNNPTKDGYTFIGGCGGTIKVDTENSTLGANDYTQIGNSYRVGLRNLEVQLEDIVNDEIETSLWEESNRILIYGN